MKNNKTGKNIKNLTTTAITTVTLLAVLCATMFGSGCSGMVSEYLELESRDVSTETKEYSTQETYAYDGLNEESEQATFDNTSFDINNIDIPEYSGKPIVKINNNKPFFTEDEITDEYFIEISDLDNLGRCGSNWMCADEPHIQEGERSNISDIHPTGWHKGGFYQRSHLLMWKLSGCNMEENLISGTDTFNQESMLEYEEQITDYLWHNVNNHVMYRVSPLFEGDNLIATGVLMEAYSVEDDGAGMCFCIFVYNVEPGYTIDYKTGDYSKN